MLDRTAVERIERMKTETTDIILKMALRHSAVAIDIDFDFRRSILPLKSGEFEKLS